MTTLERFGVGIVLAHLSELFDGVSVTAQLSTAVASDLDASH